MNLPALNGELKLKGKLKFRRKYNNKPSLPIFFSFAISDVRGSTQLYYHIRVHCHSWPPEVSLIDRLAFTTITHPQPSLYLHRGELQQFHCSQWGLLCL